MDRCHQEQGDRHQVLRLGDQAGLLDAGITERLVASVAAMLPPGVGALAIGSGSADLLIGHLLARRLSLPLAAVMNVDGRVQVRGALVPGAATWLVTSLLEDESTVEEFFAACRAAGAEPQGVVTLVDQTEQPAATVRGLVRWVDHRYPADQCPVCAGG